MPNDEIEIRYPSSIPEELKSVKGLSDAMKVHIAQRVADGKVLLQTNSTSASADSINKCEMLLEILQDRARFNKWVTLEEVKEVAGIGDDLISVFMQRLMKMAREKSLTIKKTKRDGITCYKL